MYQAKWASARNKGMTRRKIFTTTAPDFTQLYLESCHIGWAWKDVTSISSAKA